MAADESSECRNCSLRWSMLVTCTSTSRSKNQLCHSCAGEFLAPPFRPREKRIQPGYGRFAKQTCRPVFDPGLPKTMRYRRALRGRTPWPCPTALPYCRHCRHSYGSNSPPLRCTKLSRERCVAATRAVMALAAHALRSVCIACRRRHDRQRISTAQFAMPAGLCSQVYSNKRSKATARRGFHHSAAAPIGLATRKAAIAPTSWPVQRRPSRQQVGPISCGQRRMDLGDLPLIVLDEFPYSLSRKERLASLRGLGQQIETILHFDFQTNRHGRGHLRSSRRFDVYIFAQACAVAPTCIALRPVNRPASNCCIASEKASSHSALCA